MSIFLSVILPVYNESEQLPELLSHLGRALPAGAEVIFVDGGSTDDSAALVRAAGFLCLESESGRARQMNAGAQRAQGDLLLFMHADCRLPIMDWSQLIERLEHGGCVWGRFDVHIEGRSRLLPMVARAMNLRSRLTGIATGDQGIFIWRSVFEAEGGFADQPLMEDVELSRRLKRRSRPLCIRKKISTSGRQWDQRGVWRTILLMWRLRWAYWRGADPAVLLRRYRYRD
ncbi:TIGR04283 family arsenosugar biosynthesis glycosyltransferase [Marinimicrobium alkaliphilum]|uniref:TIGR04283 family arsenosugar biosynthesis glycosyltransferase n=1 Tax=Marinimicrobium alkaliphilum TaxID=2202654 RepID=UPI001E58B771|nr:TIGR04283 family arsenosugar biosynthesis glycosyltransferase [Marinimicrobium alkaliphilum]